MSKEKSLVALAQRFHAEYERLAPSFGYETRPETRVFDPESPNGKLMIAVCSALAPPDAQPAIEPAPREPIVRYCPGCGSVGAVEGKFQDCCPDGNEARFIPESLAKKCHDTFKIAINAIAYTPQPAIAPAPVLLTDDEIDNIVARHCKRESSHADADRTARAIEAAVHAKQRSRQ